MPAATSDGDEAPVESNSVTVTEKMASAIRPPMMIAGSSKSLTPIRMTQSGHLSRTRSMPSLTPIPIGKANGIAITKPVTKPVPNAQGSSDCPPQLGGELDNVFKSQSSDGTSTAA